MNPTRRMRTTATVLTLIAGLVACGSEPRHPDGGGGGGTDKEPTRVSGLDSRPVNSTCFPLQEPPDSLLDTGCFSESSATPSPALIPYDVNAPLWSDDADKERFLALPDDTTIGISSNSRFEYPPGTVLVKNFSRGGRRLETRFLVRHDDGEWDAFTYAWNEAGTDARLVGSSGLVIQTDDGDWEVPTRADCFQCHTEAAGIVLGPELIQLNGEMEYAETGRTANQLDTWQEIGLFASDLPAETGDLPALPRYDDENESVEERARAYLHANCSNCHRPGMRFSMDLRATTPFAYSGTCDVHPEQGSPTTPDARRIKPGDPDGSVILARMKSLDLAWRMPLIGSARLDEQGIALVEEWIASLESCP